MSRRRLLVIAAGLLVLAVAGASLLVPGLIASVAPTWLVPEPDARAEVAQTVLPVVAVLALLAAAVAGVRVRSRTVVPEMPTGRVEVAESDAVATVGRRFRQQCTWAANEWYRPGTESSRSREFLERLRDAAATAYALEVDVDEPTARHAVATGAWTDDPVAAWFLAEPNADVPIPLSTWIWARLRPTSTYRECVERTASTIDDLGGDR